MEAFVRLRVKTFHHDLNCVGGMFLVHTRKMFSCFDSLVNTSL